MPLICCENMASRTVMTGFLNALKRNSSITLSGEFAGLVATGSVGSASTSERRPCSSADTFGRETSGEDGTVLSCHNLLATVFASVSRPTDVSQLGVSATAGLARSWRPLSAPDKKNTRRQFWVKGVAQRRPTACVISKPMTMLCKQVSKQCVHIMGFKMTHNLVKNSN